MHTETQSTADKSLGLAALAVQMGFETAKSLKVLEQQYENVVEFEKALEEVSPEIASWLWNYNKLGALKFAEKFNETDPATVRKGMEYLDIIPH